MLFFSFLKMQCIDLFITISDEWETANNQSTPKSTTIHLLVNRAQLVNVLLFVVADVHPFKKAMNHSVWE